MFVGELTMQKWYIKYKYMLITTYLMLHAKNDIYNFMIVDS